MTSSEVAGHYNALEEKGLDARAQSRIFYLRNFNNWVKSMLIGDHLDKIRATAKDAGDRDPKIVALDLCCGKGGDLLKWKIGGINHLVCTDIADVSLKQCEDRYKEMKDRGRQERRHHQDYYTAEFIHADCGDVRLRDKYSDPNTKFDITSCQFSLHYSFASIKRAKCALRNACENLKPGGFFVGTIPNADQIVRFVESHGTPFKNEVVSVHFDKPVHSLPVFGAKFVFTLSEVVDCPEYLLHFPLLVEMLKEFGMELVFKKTFPEMEKELAAERGKGLLAKMSGLEAYPFDLDVQPMGQNLDIEYQTIKAKVDEIKQREGGGEDRKPVKVGTLSKSEWEAAAMYMAFAFRKKIA